MKKPIFFFICFLTANVLFAQEKKAATVTLNGKLINQQNCTKLTDLKSKISFSPVLDSVTAIEIFQVTNKRPSGRLSFKTISELEQFNFYNWLNSGEKMENIKSRKYENRDLKEKKYKVMPGDRLMFEVLYTKNGQNKTLIENFNICE